MFTAIQDHPEVKPRATRTTEDNLPASTSMPMPLTNTGGQSDGPAVDMQMSSLEVAEVTGKRHTEVMRDVRKMLTGLAKEEDAFLRRRLSAQNKSVPYFLLDHDLTMTLVSGYSVKLRYAVVTRLRALETGEATPWHMQEPEPEPEAPALPDFTNPAEAARAWADQHDRADVAEAVAVG